MCQHQRTAVSAGDRNLGRKAPLGRRLKRHPTARRTSLDLLRISSDGEQSLRMQQYAQTQGTWADGRIEDAPMFAPFGVLGTPLQTNRSVTTQKISLGQVGQLRKCNRALTGVCGTVHRKIVSYQSTLSFIIYTSAVPECFCSFRQL